MEHGIFNLNFTNLEWREGKNGNDFLAIQLSKSLSKPARDKNGETIYDKDGNQKYNNQYLNFKVYLKSKEDYFYKKIQTAIDNNPNSIFKIFACIELVGFHEIEEDRSANGKEWKQKLYTDFVYRFVKIHSIEAIAKKDSQEPKQKQEDISQEEDFPSDDVPF